MSFFGTEVLPWLYALALLVLGFVLVLLEIFVIPGLNIFGVLGFVTLCTGVVYAYGRLGMEGALLIAALGLTGTVLLVRLLIRNRAWRRLVLESATSREKGYTSAPSSLGELVGRRGTALTPLRPSGRARFGEQVVGVVTEGTFVERGLPVEVLCVAGSRVVVQEDAGSAPQGK